MVAFTGWTEQQPSSRHTRPRTCAGRPLVGRRSRHRARDGRFGHEPRDLTVGDIIVSGFNRYDVAGSRLLSRYVFTRGAQEVEVTALHHVYTVAHLRQLLADGGFTNIDLCGGPNGEPFEVGTGRLLLTARRG